MFFIIFGTCVFFFCCRCEEEVFNLLFVVEVDRKFVVLCFNCAKRTSPKLDQVVVLNQYKMAALCDLYDHFQLGMLVRNYLPPQPYP